MKKDKKYSGVVIPTVTPLTQDYKLDEESVENLFRLFRQHQTHPFILGTTGESASLPMELKKQYIKKASKIKEEGDVLYVGISSNCFAESVELAKLCFDEGVDVVAANLPSYYALSTNGIKKYFEDLADAVNGPLIIYNIPATTQMSIPLSLIDELSQHPNIIGLKDSERSEERLKESLSLYANRDDFSHFIGWAAKSADAVLNGSDGLIPSTGNFHPQLYQQLYEAAKRGERETAYALQEQSDVLGNMYQSGKLLGESLAALKVLMHEKGICQPYIMPPLQNIPEEEAILLRQRIAEFQNKELIHS